ncbi:UNVERIFIED_CONTAM: hypothetical protein HDU68_004578, partial [Siphonaria sp. JEL0065]
MFMILTAPGKCQLSISTSTVAEWTSATQCYHKNLSLCYIHYKVNTCFCYRCHHQQKWICKKRLSFEFGMSSQLIAASAGDNKPYTGTNYYASSFSLSAIPSLIGKTAVVTGGNSGIGFETCKHLALNGARVILTSRSKQKAVGAIARIKEAGENSGKTVSIDFVLLDLGDLNQTRDAARELARLIGDGCIDILINNAGVFNMEQDAFELASCGLESMFAVNHMGHFVWTLELLPLLLKAPSPTRIVIVSSYGTWRAPFCGIDFDSLSNRNLTFTGRHYYGQSKLANMLFATELNNRYGDKIYVNSLHPGNVATPMTAQLFSAPGSSIYTNILNAEKGSFASLYAATSNEIQELEVRGKYIVPFGVVSTDHNPLANDADLSKRLWEFSD